MKQYINNKHMSFNIKDFAKRYLTGFILGACLFSIVGSYAAVTFASNEVTYNNSSSGLNTTNVKSAIDELYKLCK